MPQEFTKRVLKFALNLRALDRSSTRGTLLSSVLTTAASFANTYNELKGGISEIIDLEQTTQVGGAPFLATKLVGSYKDNYLKELSSEIKKVYNQFGGFRKTNKEIIGTIDELNTLLHNDINQQIINSLEKRYYKNYLTGGASDDVQKVLRVVVKGNVEQTDLLLFNTFIMIMELEGGDHNKEWRWMGDVSQQGITLNPSNEYRLNLKRVNLRTDSVAGQTGNTAFLIQNFIPESGGGQIELPNGGLESDPLWLKKAFEDLLRNNTAASAYGNLDTTGSLGDKLNCDEIIRDELSKTEMDDVEMLMDDPYKVNKEIVKNGWTRMDDGNYEKKLNDGTRIVYKKDTSEYNQLFTAANRCFSSQLTASNENCCEWMDAVLKGNSEKLLDFINTNKISFLGDAKNINQAHPLLVLKVLKAFGFREELVYDMEKPGGYNGKIWKIQTINKWKTKYLDRKFPPAQVTSIMGNTKLILYLSLLVDYVNANPSLINEGMVKSSGMNIQKIQVPEEFEKRGVIPCIAPSKKNKYSTDWNELSKNINNVQGSFFRGMNFNSHLPFGMTNLLPLTQTWGFGNVFRGTTLRGGSHDGKQEVFIDQKETVPQFTHQVGKEINTLLTRLNGLNKPLKKSDVERIKNKLNDFHRLEVELYNTILMINKYAQLASIFNKDSGRETVSMSTINNYVNRYQPLVDKYENTKTGLEGLLTILKEINDDDEDDVNPSILKTRPISI